MKKIKIIQEVAGMEVGVVKFVKIAIADNLIQRGLAEEVKEKAPKKEA